MAKHLAKKLVDLSDRRLGAKPRSELGLNHGEGRFDVRPLVVVRQEFLAAIAEQMKRPLPNLGSSVPFERRRASYAARFTATMPARTNRVRRTIRPLGV
jgi:hypothetical protein